MPRPRNRDGVLVGQFCQIVTGTINLVFRRLARYILWVRRVRAHIMVCCAANVAQAALARIRGMLLRHLDDQLLPLRPWLAWTAAPELVTRVAG